MRRLWMIAFASLYCLGCSSSHASPDAGDAADAAASDAGQALDAGRSGFTSCAPASTAESFGEGCFCGGPAALYGSTLYRQSIGVEVWDVSDPLNPVDAGHVNERAASQGGVAIYDGHLLTLTNFEPALRVYSLVDPIAPVLRSSIELTGDLQFGIAVAPRGLALVYTDGPDGRLSAFDLADLDRPRSAWEVPVAGSVTSVVADDERAYVATRETTPTRIWLEVRSLDGGELLDRHLMEDGDDASFFMGLALHRGRLLRTTVEALSVLDVSGPTPVEVGRLETPGERPTTVAVSGDLAVLGGGSLVVVDLSVPARPRELGRGPVGLGDSRALLLEGGDVAYFSNGNGFVPVALNCR